MAGPLICPCECGCPNRTEFGRRCAICGPGPCRRPKSDAHATGDPHRYRIECQDCGQVGTVRLSVEPQSFESDPWDSPEGKRMILESEAYADAMLGEPRG